MPEPPSDRAADKETFAMRVALRTVCLTLIGSVLLGACFGPRRAEGQDLGDEPFRAKGAQDATRESADIADFGKPATPRGKTAIVWNTRYLLYGDPALDVVYGPGGVVLGLKSRFVDPNAPPNYLPDQRGLPDYQQPGPLVLLDRATHKPVMAYAASVLNAPYTITSCALGPDGTLYVAEEVDGGKSIAVTAFNPPGEAGGPRNPLDLFPSPRKGSRPRP